MIAFGKNSWHHNVIINRWRLNMNKTAIKTGFPIGEYLSIASPSFVLENLHSCSFGSCASSSIRMLFSNQNLINRIYVTLLNWKQLYIRWLKLRDSGSQNHFRWSHLPKRVGTTALMKFSNFNLIKLYSKRKTSLTLPLPFVEVLNSFTTYFIQ